jgi:hypothetical protein
MSVRKAAGLQFEAPYLLGGRRQTAEEVAKEKDGRHKHEVTVRLTIDTKTMQNQLKNVLAMLLLTSTGERLKQPDFGSSLGAAGLAGTKFDRIIVDDPVATTEVTPSGIKVTSVGLMGIEMLMGRQAGDPLPVCWGDKTLTPNKEMMAKIEARRVLLALEKAYSDALDEPL